MIRRVGIICQDANSRGFLMGLQQRIGCPAELEEPTIAVGRSSTMTRRQAKLAWLDFQHKGVDLIIRFTDADVARWQDVRRQELAVFPSEARSLLVCGVATANVEEWLALEPHYLAGQLEVPEAELRTSKSLAALIKSRLLRIQGAEENRSDVVARLVSGASVQVFRKWLENEALRTFYDDCRAAAASAGRPVNNES